MKPLRLDQTLKFFNKDKRLEETISSKVQSHDFSTVVAGTDITKLKHLLSVRDMADHNSIMNLSIDYNFRLNDAGEAQVFEIISSVKLLNRVDLIPQMRNEFSLSKVNGSLPKLERVPDTFYATLGEAVNAEIRSALQEIEYTSKVVGYLETNEAQITDKLSALTPNALKIIKILQEENEKMGKQLKSLSDALHLPDNSITIHEPY